jgi:type II secretory pathway pseudopilin PulG
LVGARYKGVPFSSRPIDVQLIKFALVWCTLVAVGLAVIARIRIARGPRWLKGKGLAVGVMVLAVLESIVIPNLLPAGRRSMHSLAASDAKTAVTQAIVFANDKGVYPTSLKVLHEAGYYSSFFYSNWSSPDPDNDPWGNPYVLSPLLTQGAKPKPDDHVWVCSKGPGRTGLCGWPPLEGPPPETEGGSVGYSSIYGSWRGY